MGSIPIVASSDGAIAPAQRSFRFPRRRPLISDDRASSLRSRSPRARLAQQTGVIRGIIFHQGESDTGQAAWVDKVKGLVTDLRTDLGIGDVPFVAGELLYGGCCDAHNPIIAQIPDRIPNSFVVSAEGLTGQDDAHFDLAGQRELGKRYGQQMIDALR